MTSKLQLQATEDDRGERLDKFLARALPHVHGVPLSRRALRRLIDQGAVYVDRRRVRTASKPLRAGNRIEVYAGDANSSREPGPQRSPDPATPRVLFRDRHLLAIDKPSGLPSQATRSDALNHAEAVVRDLLRREGRTRPFVALPHRLDQGTSGVLVVALSRQSLRSLSDSFARRQVAKVYRALCVAPSAQPHTDLEPAVEEWSDGGRSDGGWVDGALHNRALDDGALDDGLQDYGRGSWRVELPLRTVRESSGKRRAQVDSLGQEAVTHCRVLTVTPALWQLEARPYSGRMHQVRVHLSSCALPVLGDRLYGQRGPRVSTGSKSGEGPARTVGTGGPRLMLHAWRYVLPHPVSGEALCLQADLPEDFRTCLRRAWRPGKP